MIPHKTNGNLRQRDTVLHPARSINPYHKAPALKMESVDVPLIDRKTEREGRGDGKGAEEGEEENREDGIVCGKKRDKEACRERRVKNEAAIMTKKSSAALLL